MGLLVLNETLAPIAALLLFWSIERGPVSLVSAIAGAQPVFVFIYAVILSRISSVLLEQRMGKRTLALRFVSIAMIVGGITIIHLV
jgi:drug/metabolite transporter (DMT)-like permease